MLGAVGADICREEAFFFVRILGTHVERVFGIDYSRGAITVLGSTSDPALGFASILLRRYFCHWFLAQFYTSRAHRQV